MGFQLFKSHVRELNFIHKKQCRRNVHVSQYHDLLDSARRETAHM